ncbi:MAG: AAA family ATPase [Acidobacteriota bacterium]|nr:AAA family ATPase [Acidobacteriota bacterium]
MKNLPIGIQTFEKIRNKNYLYVDKTGYFNDLIEGGYYFFSRPRRFGKSLLISTLEALFQGRKDLFKGLAVTASGYDFPIYPVIRLDFSIISNRTPDILEQEVKEELDRIARAHGLSCNDSLLTTRFRNLIRDMSRQAPVVILIDEYDKPILDHLADPDTALANRDKLREFYGVVKGLDAHIHMVFLTGITKFAKMSIFSELNNLFDLSNDVNHAGLLGWTQEEMDRDLKPHIEYLAEMLGRTTEDTEKILAEMYNGYRFSKADICVYNPWSVINAVKRGSIDNFWYTSGSPKFLMDEMSHRLRASGAFNIRNLYNIQVRADMMPTLEIGNAELETLLLQAGYLTIKGSSGTLRDPYLHLGFPNREVEVSLWFSLMHALVPKAKIDSGDHLAKLVTALNEEDLETFFTILRGAFFANIPYELHLPYEKYYQTVFHTIFLLLEIRIRAEESTNVGRIDGVLETDDRIYIIEFKLDDSAAAALQQAKDKGYADKYRNSGKKIILVGVGFKERNIDGWVHEVIDRSNPV